LVDVLSRSMVTDMPLNKMVSEIIREKLSANLFDELPHSINVEVVNLQRKGAGWRKGTDRVKALAYRKTPFCSRKQTWRSGAGFKRRLALKEGLGLEKAAGLSEVLTLKNWPDL